MFARAKEMQELCAKAADFPRMFRRRAMTAPLLQCRDRLFLRDGGEILEELRKGLSGFDVIEQGLKRNSRADEDRRPAQDLGIAMDDGFFGRRHRLGPSLSRIHPPPTSSL